MDTELHLFDRHRLEEDLATLCGSLCSARHFKRDPTERRGTNDGSVKARHLNYRTTGGYRVHIRQLDREAVRRGVYRDRSDDNPRAVGKCPIDLQAQGSVKRQIDQRPREDEAGSEERGGDGGQAKTKCWSVPGGSSAGVHGVGSRRT